MNRIGVICEVRGALASVMLDDELRTNFLPVLQASANANSVSFAPPRVGEQVLVIAVNGEINHGVILRGLYQNDYQLEAEENVEKVEFSDGTKINYDTKNHVLNVSTVGTINLTAPRGLNISAPAVNMSGKLNVASVITDGHGDLTNHSHSCTCGATASPR